jgi:hypothetical protein
VLVALRTHRAIAPIAFRMASRTHLGEAIRSARANGFVHNEGLANELAARRPLS